MTEPIEMPFWVWTLVGPKKHVLGGGCTLANPTEPSLCVGDAAFFQISLTTCFML